MKMTICLVIQKDTLENNKVKSVLKVIDNKPEDFVSNLQEGHCIPYQLVAHTKTDPVLLDQIINSISDCKTSHGKDWYELDMDSLSKVISLFLENNQTVINFTTISSIFGFSFQVFPVVTKEIKITTNEKNKKEIVSLIESLQEEPKRRKDKKTTSSRKE